MLKMEFSHINRFFLFMATAVVLLMLPELAHAIPMPPGFEVPEADKSRVMLKMLLGDVVDVADGTSTSVQRSTAITQVLASIAPIVSITGALLLTYTMLVGIMNTANEGETLGRKWSTIWIPARSSAAMAFILPVPAFGGLSGIQLVVIWLTLIGSGGANIVWNEAADAFTAKPVYMAPTTVDTSIITTALVNSTCYYLHEKYLGDTDRVSTGDGRAPESGGQSSGSGGAHLKSSAMTLSDGTIVNNYQWGNFDSAASCGSIQFPIGYDASRASRWSRDNRGDGIGSYFGMAYDYTAAWLGNDAANSRIDAAIKLTTKTAVAYGRTVEEVIKQADAIAERMVFSEDLSDKDIDKDKLRQLVLWYDQETTKVAREDSAESIDAMVTQFKSDVDRDGWAMAGVYFWRLVMMQEALNEATNQTSKTTSVPTDALTDSVDQESLTNTYPLYAEKINAATAFVGSVGTLGKSRAAMELDNEASKSYLENAIEHGPLDAVYSMIGRGLLNWLSNSSDNPLMALKNFGDTLLTFVGWLMVLLGAAKIASFIPIAKVGLAGMSKLQKVTKFAGGKVGGFMMMVLSFLAIALFVVAFLFAYYLPAIPYIIWVAAIMGWLIYTSEALIAAPLWIVMHAHPDGEGPSGSHGAPGYMILLSLVLRPTLLVIGLVTSLGILYVMGFFLKETLILSQSYLDPESSKGFFANISIVLLYCAILYKIINESFEQIHALASSVMGWIGGSAKNLGESGAQAEVRSTVMAGAGVVKQGTQGAMAAGQNKTNANGLKAGLKNPDALKPQEVMDKSVQGSDKPVPPAPTGGGAPAGNTPGAAASKN